MELSDRGVGVGKPLLDRPRRSERRQRLARLAYISQQRPMFLWLSREDRLESADSGLASASFCWIARANDAVPPRPASTSHKMPMLLWLFARSLERSDGGVASGRLLNHPRRLIDTIAAKLHRGWLSLLQYADIVMVPAPGELKVGDGGLASASLCWIPVLPGTNPVRRRSQLARLSC